MMKGQQPSTLLLWSYWRLSCPNSARDGMVNPPTVEILHLCRSAQATV
jgi:hypothetical protein